MPTYLNWIELSKTAFKSNIKSLGKIAGKSKLSICVKANAYGHGLKEIVSLALKEDSIAYLTVHSVAEAMLCRQSGWQKNILLLGPFLEEEISAIIEHDLEPSIFEIDSLIQLSEMIKKQAKPVKTHLKLETGTNRQGITEKQLEEFANVYKSNEFLKFPYGVSMHFANVEDTVNHEFADQQLDSFHSLVNKLKELQISPTVLHTASSAAMILFEKTHLDLVRPGIAVYGCWPSKETRLSYELGGGTNNLFEPVLSWKSRISHIKEVPENSFIGYGCSFKTVADSKIAIVPVGYADGYSRSLSDSAHVLIGGKRAPVRGRICMNLIMVEITNIETAKIGDTVSLLGNDGAEQISAEQLANWSGTINYEFLARLSPLISKIIKE